MGTTTLPLNADGYFTFGMKDDKINLNMSWATVDKTSEGLDKLLEINVSASYPADDKYNVGRFSVGWSPDGKMANGDYVFAIPTIDQCIKAYTNTKIGSPPTGASPFDVYYPKMEIESTGFKISFMRPFTSTNNTLTSNGNRLMLAAGSPAKTPTDCDTPLSFKFHHDLGKLGYVQSPEALFNFVGDESSVVV